MRREPALNRRLAAFGTTIFAEMSALAVRTGAINLGQGFPDTDGPPEVLDAAVHAIRSGRNQYPPGPGTPELRQAIAEHQRRFWDLDVDPDGEVLVTAGATEAIAAAMLALCEPGDEVVAFEPTYDSYGAAVAMAGATLRPVTLEHPDLAIDLDAVAAAITPQTRLLLLNTPHNPTGKVCSTEELEGLARLCIDHDLIAVTDEVYEHLVFDGVHRPLAGFPGMAERTLTISSAGKTFSCTGWKVGWITGPRELVSAVQTAKQFLTFVNAGPFQPAVALGLGLGDEVYDELRTDLLAKRDLLCEGLAAAGFEIHRPQGTYFATVDVRSIGEDDAMAFCRSLPERCGVVAIPSSVFYADPATGRSLVRFAFCKRTEVLTEAVSRLKTLA
ncbi:MAG: pyridoxal phosphate-dependent aminotransferase [Actinomycetota bacterium]|nr:pyridoxal phosphate-dependent aminotransferase [Actinomycetota bacterium]